MLNEGSIRPHPTAPFYLTIWTPALSLSPSPLHISGGTFALISFNLLIESYPCRRHWHHVIVHVWDKVFPKKNLNPSVGNRVLGHRCTPTFVGFGGKDIIDKHNFLVCQPVVLSHKIKCHFKKTFNKYYHLSEVFVIKGHMFKNASTSQLALEYVCHPFSS